MAAALSLEEYLSVCALIEGQDIDDDTTYGTFSAAIGDVIERMSPLAPPAEIADWHNKTLEILQTFKGLVDTQPEDQLISYPINTKNSGTPGRWTLIRRVGIVVDGASF